MQEMTTIAAVSYTNCYGDSASAFLVYSPGTTRGNDIYEVHVLGSEDDRLSGWWRSDNSETWLRNVQDVEGETMHGDDDDDDHDEDDCEHCGLVDTADAARFLYDKGMAWRQLRANDATSEVVGNHVNVRNALVGSRKVRHPECTAVFSFDADRLTIRNAVIRALEARDVADTEIARWTYEADTTPDILSVAAEWVTLA